MDGLSNMTMMNQTICFQDLLSISKQNSRLLAFTSTKDCQHSLGHKDLPNIVVLQLESKDPQPSNILY